MVATPLPIPTLSTLPELGGYVQTLAPFWEMFIVAVFLIVFSWAIGAGIASAFGIASFTVFITTAVLWQLGYLAVQWVYGTLVLMAAAAFYWYMTRP